MKITGNPLIDIGSYAVAIAIVSLFKYIFKTKRPVK
jgi:hypothetical protein